MVRVFAAACTMMAAFVALSSAVTSGAPRLADLFESYPVLKELSDRWTDADAASDWMQEIGVTMETARETKQRERFLFVEQTKMMKELFRFLDARRTKLYRFLESASNGDESTTIGEGFGSLDPGARLHKFLQDLVELDAGKKFEAVLEKAGKRFQKEKFSSSASSNSSSSFFAPPAVASATNESREQCRIDYGGFVEPITNSIYNAVRQLICDLLGLGPILCNNLLPPQPDLEMPQWGPRMIDAMAKIPNTLIEGPLSWVGAYDLCEKFVDVTYNHSGSGTERHFEGKYCRLDMTTMPSPVQENSSDLVLPPITLQFGVCVPDSCYSEDVKSYITEDNLILAVVLRFVLNMEITAVFCGMEDLEAKSDGALITALTISLIFLVIVVVATVYDAFVRKRIMKKQVEVLNSCVDQMKKDEKKDDPDRRKNQTIPKLSIGCRLEMLFVGFSAYTNFRKIFTVRDKPGDIPVLNGIRYLSFVYVMWGETFVLGPLYQEAWTSANLLGAIPRLTQGFLFQTIINFHLAEDSFLLISGICVTYWFLMRFEANNKRLTIGSIVYYFVHRYWRLMPVMMLSIMIFTCTYKYAADGPLFPAEDQDGENCRVTWWVNLLMVSNLVKVDQQCFGHAWFVPLIFQLHLAAIVVVIPLVIRPVFGYIMIAVMWVAHIGAAAGVSSNLRKDGHLGEWYDEYLITPWCRAGPFVIGLAYGVLLFKKRFTGLHIHRLLSLAFWVVSFVCVLAPAFASYSQYGDGPEKWAENRWSDDALIAYDTLARSSWGLGLGWMAVACHFGYGGVINSFLSWKPFVPLSRLVYTTLLMHGMFIFNFVYTSRMPIYIDSYHSMYALFGHLIICMIVGLVLSLLWDLPLGTGVEKAVLCKDRFQWIRSGRHPRRHLNGVERAFLGGSDDDDDVTAAEKNALAGTTPPGPVVLPPGCNYVDVSPLDYTWTDSYQNNTEAPTGNNKNVSVVHENPAFDKDEIALVTEAQTRKSPTPDYEQVIDRQNENENENNHEILADEVLKF